MTTSETVESAENTEPAEARQAPKRRVGALDVARGVLLVTSVSTDAVIGTRPKWLTHSDFSSLTYYDTIFPCFVALSGIGLGFAYRSKVGWRVTGRRFTVLFICGLIFNGLKDDGVSLANWVVMSPLSIYAVLVLCAAVLSRRLKTARSWAIFTLTVAVVWSVALRLFANGCADGVLTRSCNPSRVVDHALLGGHMQYHGTLGYDPVGFVALVGALVNLSLGVTMAHIYSENKDRVARFVPRAVGWCAVVVLSGFALSFVIPAYKAVWTPSYALLAGSLGILLFVAAFLVVDARPNPVKTAACWPLVALGRNSLLVYFGSHLLMSLLNRSPSSVKGVSMAEMLSTKIDLIGHPRLSLVAAALIFWWGLALVLHRLKIYVKA